MWKTLLVKFGEQRYNISILDYQYSRQTVAQYMKKKVIEITVVIIILASIAYWFVAMRPEQRITEQVQEATQAIEQVVESTPAVAPETNPAASAVPAVNPLGKTNPFKSEYENPFK